MDLKRRKLSRKLLLRLFPPFSRRLSKVLRVCADAQQWRAGPPWRLPLQPDTGPGGIGPLTSRQPAAQPSGRWECGSEQRCSEEIRETHPHSPHPPTPATVVISFFHNPQPQAPLPLLSWPIPEAPIRSCRHEQLMSHVLGGAFSLPPPPLCSPWCRSR